ncbi:hypothetical protein D9758_009855 [Tetrapyrgos nigripes]|uniref:Uncharacterized protein n=1 Tax=Tetrapyrgos nigripes TaxID=182062 RepID=A0A8H5GMV3_9AGAR|nr:hypothetical protein D9758_009855 [Tetrapyrgos nigripes]
MAFDSNASDAQGTLLSDEAIARMMRPYITTMFSEFNSKWQTRMDEELRKQREEFDALLRDTRWQEFLQACTTRSQVVEEAVHRAERAEASVRKLEKELVIVKERAAKVVIQATAQSFGKSAVLKALDEGDEEQRDSDGEDEDATKVHSSVDTKVHPYHRKTLTSDSKLSSSRLAKSINRSQSCPRPMISRRRPSSAPTPTASLSRCNPQAQRPLSESYPHPHRGDSSSTDNTASTSASDLPTPRPGNTDHGGPLLGGFAFPSHRLSLSQSTNDTTSTFDSSAPLHSHVAESEAALKDVLRSLSKYKRPSSITSISSAGVKT